MPNLTEWEPIDDEAEDQYDEDFAGASSEFYKLGAGTHRVRVLPKRKGEESHRKIVHEHFIDVPGQQNKISFACPRLMTRGKERCPVCDEADALKRTRNPIAQGRAKELYPRMRIYMNVIVRGKEEEGPKVVAVPKSIWERMKKLKTKFGDYTNPTDAGYDIIIERAGSSKDDTKYEADAARSNSVLGTPEQIAEWIEARWDLAFYAALPERDELAKFLPGAGPVRGAPRTLPSGTERETRRAAPDTRKRRTAQDDVETRAIDAEFREHASDDDDIPY